MKIAVCDDELNDRMVLAEYLDRFDVSLEKRLFVSAEDLLRGLENDYFDLIFLDIEMTGLDGFRAAKKINENGDSPLIVFVTKSSKYTIRGYEVAFRYLVKPLSYDNFLKVIKAAVEKIVPKKISVEINGRTYLISTNDIYYIEVFNHNTVIHTKSVDYDSRNPLKDIEELLDGCPFVRPHNSYLVNMDHIESLTSSEIILSNKTRLSISRYRKDEVLKAFHQYLRR